MLGCGTIAEAAIAAAGYSISGSGSILTEGLSEVASVLDATAVFARFVSTLSESFAVDGVTRLPGLPLDDGLTETVGIAMFCVADGTWLPQLVAALAWHAVSADDGGWIVVPASPDIWSKQ